MGVIGPFHKPKDKLSEELEQLKKTKADLERQARRLETELNIPHEEPKIEEVPKRGARFIDIHEDTLSDSENLPQKTSAQLKVELRNARKRFLWLAVIVIILILLILKVIS